jgi:hypothetical protein
VSPTRAADVRARRAARAAHDEQARWRFRRAVARTRVVDEIVADFATSWCGRPVRRPEGGPLESAVQLPGVRWTLEGDVMVELLYDEGRPSRLVVHEIALLQPLRKALRTRHVTVEHVGFA